MEWSEVVEVETRERERNGTIVCEVKGPLDPGRSYVILAGIRDDKPFEVRLTVAPCPGDGGDSGESGGSGEASLALGREEESDEGLRYIARPTL